MPSCVVNVLPHCSHSYLTGYGAAAGMYVEFINMDEFIDMVQVASMDILPGVIPT